MFGIWEKKFISKGSRTGLNVFHNKNIKKFLFNNKSVKTSLVIKYRKDDITCSYISTLATVLFLLGSMEVGTTKGSKKKRRMVEGTYIFLQMK
jgi:hypothetical protein